MKDYFEYMANMLDPIAKEQKEGVWDEGHVAFVLFSDDDQTGILAAGRRGLLVRCLAEAIIRDKETRKILQSALRLARKENEKPTPQKFLLGESVKKPLN
jgi:hypothetical protein